MTTLTSAMIADSNLNPNPLNTLNTPNTLNPVQPQVSTLMEEMLRVFKDNLDKKDDQIADLVARIQVLTVKPPTPLKVKDVEAYDGQTGRVEDWIFQMEQYFNAKGIAPDKQVTYASLRLTGRALLWWRDYSADDATVASRTHWKDFCQYLTVSLQPMNPVG